MIWILSALSVLSMWSVLYLNRDFYSAPTITGSAILILTIILGAAISAKMARPKFARIVVISTTSLILFTSVYLLCQHWSLERKVQRVRRVVVALESFKKNHGAYPNRLSEVPELGADDISEVDSYEVGPEAVVLYFHLATRAITNFYSSRVGWGRSDD